MPGPVHPDTIKRRRKICGMCPYQSKVFKVLGVPIANAPQCTICKCNINWKTETPGEKCPKDFWKNPSKMGKQMK